MADFGRHCSALLQGTEEFTDVLNTPDIVTTPLTGLPDTYSHVFQFVGGASREGLTWAQAAQNQTPPTANHIIVGLWLRFSDLSPTTEYKFLGLAGAGSSDVTSTDGLNLVLETGGDIRVRDDADATIAIITTPLTVDTWHRFEIRFIPDTGAADGEVQIWLDGAEILGNQTGEDLLGYSGMDHVVVGGSPTASETVFFAGAYTVINSAAASDRLDADFEIVGPYSIGQTGASPDNNGDNDVTPDTDGDDLDGDGKPERFDQYQRKIELPIPERPQGKLCGKTWEIVEMHHQPFLYVFHLSKGEYIVIESMMFLLTGKHL